MRYPWDDQPDPGFYGPEQRFPTAPPMPPVSEPDYMGEMQGTQFPMPNDFWARVSQGTGGQGPFGQMQLPQKFTGLEALAALLSGFANAKTQQAGQRTAQVERQNAQSSANARALAQRRWGLQRDRDREATQMRANIAASQARPKPQTEYEKTSERIRAFKEAGLQVPGTATKTAAAKPATGLQRSTMAFYLRGKESVDTISAPEVGGKSLEDVVSGATIVQQGQMKFAPNPLKSDEQQRYVQAQRAFTEARLRKESGAAINPSEYENDAKTYFAQPGDRAPVMAQKKRLRQKVLDGLKFGAGPAFDEYYSGQQPTGDVRWIMDDAGNLVPE